MDHKYEIIELTKGPRGLLISVPGSKVLNITMGFLAGFNYSNSKQVELPHVMEHTIFGANSRYASMLEVTAEFEKNGAYHNAFTDEFLLGYDAECAVFEDVSILEQLTTCISSAKFLKAEIKSEIGNVREELNNRISNHGQYARDLILKKMVGFRTDKDGLKSLANVNQERLMEYRKKTHTARNLRFILAGNLRHKGQLVRRLEEFASKLDRGYRPKLQMDKPSASKKAIIEQRDIPDIHYRFVQWFPEFNNEKHRAAAHILNSILSWRWKSWIFGEARRLGLAYVIRTHIDTNPLFDAFEVAGFVTQKNSQRLFQLVSEKLHQARAGRFAQEEIDSAKKYYIGNMLRAYKTPGNLMGWYGEDFMTEDKIYDFSKTLKVIESISVNDVTHVSKHILNVPLWGFSAVGNIDQGQADSLTETLAEIWK